MGEEGCGAGVDETFPDDETDIYAGLSRLIETVSRRPLMSSMKNLSALSKTLYGPL